MKTMIKQLGLLIVMLFTILPIYAFEFEFENINYEVISLDEMTCKIKGIANISEDKKFDIPACVSYNGREFKVVEIGTEAFYRCNDIIKINMNDASNLSIIGTSAFENCQNLKEVTIAPSCTKIKDSAFKDCIEIESIIIPSSCEKIEIDAFFGCTSLQHLVFEQSEQPLILTWKDKSKTTDPYFYFGQFAKCPIRELNIQRNIEYNGELNKYSNLNKSSYDNVWTFYYYPWIDQCSESLSIGAMVTRIPYNLLLTTNPKNLNLEDSDSELDIEPLTTYTFSYHEYIYGDYKRTEDGYIDIKDYSMGSHHSPAEYFRGFYMPNLESILWGRKVTAKIFEGGENKSDNTKYVSIYSQKLQTFELGKNLIEFGAVAPFSAYSLTEIKWNEVIKECTLFKETYSIKMLDFPESLEKISGFNNSKDVKEIHFGRNVTEIQGFTRLNVESIYISAPTPPEIDAFSDNTYIESTLYVPYGSLSAYSQATNWKNFWNIKEFQPNSIETIYNQKNKTEVTRFDCHGNKVNEGYKGIIVIKYSDGSTKKILQK